MTTPDTPDSLPDAPESGSTARAKQPADERAYQTHFPGVPHLTSAKGYSPLPWYLRSTMWIFSPREWQLLTYFIMHGGKRAISWQTNQEIGAAFDMGHKKVNGYIKMLSDKGFIATKTFNGKRYVIVVDPYEALKVLVARGEIKGLHLVALNEDLAKIGREEFVAPVEPASTGA